MSPRQQFWWWARRIAALALFGGIIWMAAMDIRNRANPPHEPISGMPKGDIRVAEVWQKDATLEEFQTAIDGLIRSGWTIVSEDVRTFRVRDMVADTCRVYTLERQR